MKLKIRHADKIVGFFIVTALLFLSLAAFLLGGKQSWFAPKYYYTAVLESAAGVGENMPVLYNGFSIGSVESMHLNDDDMIEVKFYVLEQYRNRVRQGSLVEVEVSLVDWGDEFLFYSGLGGELDEGALIPGIDTAAGKQLLTQGLSMAPRNKEDFSSLLVKANNFLDDADVALLKIDETSVALSRLIGNMEISLASASAVLSTMESAMKPILEDVKKSSANIEAATRAISNPDGSLLAALDAEGALYKNLAKTLAALAGTLAQVEKTAGLLPGQVPNAAGLIEELRVTVRSAEDVLEALKNNPLLRGGVPSRVDTGSGGTGPRNIGF